jgi:hypothetical protein
MAGGVIKIAVPDLCTGFLCVGWSESHVDRNQSSIEQRQAGKSFRPPADHPDGADMHWIIPSKGGYLSVDH